MNRAFRRLAAALLVAWGAVSGAWAGDISEDLLAAAIQRYEAGEYQSAIGSINAALRGRLPGSLIPKAYYYRGLANRKAGRPGEAINDLTRAMGQPGLMDAERSDAKENLQVAYQEAGLSPRETVVVARETNAAPPARTPLPALRGTMDGKTDTTPITTGAVASQPATSKVAAVAAWSTSTTSAPAGRSEPAAAPASPTPRSSAWTNHQVALAPLPTVPVPVEKRKAPATDNATVKRAALPSVPVASPFATVVSATPELPGNEVRLLVGDASSRGEAIQLAVRLTSQRGAVLGPRRPQIAASADAASYRLRLGPFTDTREAMALCQSLRESGYACVTE